MMNDEIYLQELTEKRDKRIHTYDIEKRVTVISLVVFVVSIILIFLFHDLIVLFVVFSFLAIAAFTVFVSFFSSVFGYKKDIRQINLNISRTELKIETARDYANAKRNVLNLVGIIDIVPLGYINVGYGNRKLYVWNKDYIDYGAYTQLEYDEELKNDVLVRFQSISIHEDDIVFYCKEGDVQYTTEVSGGGGGGYSLSGAIVGGLIAGGVGAIIGSRKENEEITSRSVMHDTRFTLLRYRNNDSFLEMKFPAYGVYEFLLKYIPKKDLLYLQMARGNDASTVKAETAIEDKLISLKSLYDKKLISEDEYITKKNQLLDSL